MVRHESGERSDGADELRWLDRLLQRWRIYKASRFIARGDRVLDIGCADGTLFSQLAWIEAGLGIDPNARDSVVRGIPIRRGHFPDDLAGEEGFQVVTALAVFEHVPLSEQAQFVVACRAALASGGRVVLTVPAPLVDHLISILQALRLLRGMETHEHWGFRPADTIPIFTEHGFEATLHRRFQLGLNHLFVFTAT
jgi:2-polyprenyl-3-methyl-5-hydroxy-6-metoxy-1,4-benzoquinol methylase